MQSAIPSATAPVALLNCGDNLDALKIADALARKGYDLLLVCQPTLQEAATRLQDAILKTGRQCRVAIRRMTSMEFYRQLLTIIYLNFGSLNLYIDYATPQDATPTPDQAQVSATLMWMYMLFMPSPIKEMSFNMLRQHYKTKRTIAS
jgi:hypothetical protein